MPFKNDTICTLFYSTETGEYRPIGKINDVNFTPEDAENTQPLKFTDTTVEMTFKIQSDAVNRKALEKLFGIEKYAATIIMFPRKKKRSLMRRKRKQYGSRRGKTNETAR